MRSQMGGLGTPPQMNVALDEFALELEALLVSSDCRGMARVRAQWQSGYLRRAAEMLLRHHQRVAIVSGFPVGDSYETDGPAGAMALLQAIKACGGAAQLYGIEPYIERLRGCEAFVPGLQDNDLVAIVNDDQVSAQFRQKLADFAPTLLIFVEVPGRAIDGCCYNMRFEDITDRTLAWELLLELAPCPSIAFADGGNELGMGAAADALKQLSIAPAISTTDALVLSDISNWGAYGLLALLSVYVQKDLLQGFRLSGLLEQLSRNGIVDGVTGVASASEDGLPAASGEALLHTLRERSRAFTAAQLESASACSGDESPLTV